jgi:hypothetical protein
LHLKYVTPLPLATIETEALLKVKSSRSRGEYCWTLTPFTPDLIFSLDKAIKRITYLDADLFFFDNPAKLFQEFEDSGKHVMITEHAYAPEYIKYLELSGRFCVQFMVFDRSSEARTIMQWWQERCIEWCFARHEDGKFGDQKYLDLWPKMFGNDVHILNQTHQTLAPWNVDFFLTRQAVDFKPVLYHFHSFRIVAENKVRLWEGYKIGNLGRDLYKEYLQILNKQVRRLASSGISLPFIRDNQSISRRIRGWIAQITGKTVKVSLSE